MLDDRRVLALKQVRGSLGEGFYKLEASAAGPLANGEPIPGGDVDVFAESLEGYIVTEYLRPHSEMHAFSAGAANTVRYLVGNDRGEPVFLKAFVRFGTERSGFVENYNSGGVMCFADEGGFFRGGNQLDPGTGANRVLSHHPDTGAPLEGRVPLWDDMSDAAARFCRAFPQLRYLGFDFVATDGRGVKMLEINSLSSLDAIQLDCSVFDSPNGWWFKKTLEESR